MAEKAADALLTQPVEQNVGEGSAGLTFPRRQSRHTMREMQRQTSVRRQHQHVVIPVLRRRRAHGDLFWARPTRRDEFAYPTQGFDGLSTWLGAGDGLRRRRR